MVDFCVRFFYAIRTFEFICEHCVKMLLTKLIPRAIVRLFNKNCTENIVENTEAEEIQNCEIKLIVGLGNPGSEYDGTRHNIGFEVIDELAQRFGAKAKSRCKSQVYEIEYAGKKLFLQKPKTFMNLSGDAVKALRRKEKLNPSEILVVYDEMSLPLERMRIRLGGSPAGHNGVKSMIERLATKDFYRLRLGIGRPQNEGNVSDYVLSKFDDVELPSVKEVVEHAADAVLMLCSESCEATMNKYNGDVSRFRDPDQTCSVTKSGDK